MSWSLVFPKSEIVVWSCWSRFLWAFSNVEWSEDFDCISFLLTANSDCMLWYFWRISLWAFSSCCVSFWRSVICAWRIITVLEVSCSSEFLFVNCSWSCCSSAWRVCSWLVLDWFEFLSTLISAWSDLFSVVNCKRSVSNWAAALVLSSKAEIKFLFSDIVTWSCESRLDFWISDVRNADSAANWYVWERYSRRLISNSAVCNFLVSFLCSFSFDLISVFNFFLYFFEVVSASFILASANVERDSAKAVWYVLNSKINLFLFSVG
jgi:hypothetical protein